MVGRDQYGYIKGPYYMVKPGPKPPGEHNKVESKKLHKLDRFPNLRAAGKAFSHMTCHDRSPCICLLASVSIHRALPDPNCFRAFYR